MTTTAATIRIALEANTASLQRGFASMKAEIGGLKSSVSAGAGAMAGLAHGAVVVQTALAAAQKIAAVFVESIDRLSKQHDTASQLGLLADQFAALSYAAEQTGASAEAVQTGLVKMSKNLSEAQANGGAAAAAFAELGLDVNALMQTDASTQFATIADAMKNVENQTDRVRLAQEIFGRGGAALVNMLQDGSAGLQAYADDFAALGGALGNNRAAVDEAGDAIVRLKTAWRSFKDQFVILIAPVLTWASNTIAYLTGKINRLFGYLRGQSGNPKIDLSADQASQIAPISAAAAKEMAAADKAAEAAQKKMKERATSLAESLRTPAEVFADSVKEMQELYAAQAITWETYLRGLTRARTDLLKSRPAETAASKPIGAATAAGNAYSVILESRRAQVDAERRHRDIATWLARIYERMNRLQPELAPVTI